MLSCRCPPRALVVAGSEPGDDITQRAELGRDRVAALAHPLHLGTHGSEFTLGLGLTGGADALGLGAGRGDDLLGLPTRTHQQRLGLALCLLAGGRRLRVGF